MRFVIIRRKANPVWIKLRELLKQGREEDIFHFRSLDHTMTTVLGVILFHMRDYFMPILVGDSNDHEAGLNNRTADNNEQLCEERMHG